MRLPPGVEPRKQGNIDQALESLWRQTMDHRGGCVLEVDIRKFFDTLDHAHLRDLLRQRIRDGVWVLRCPLPSAVAIHSVCRSLAKL
jgi:retron-type reverse transcriptase